MSLVEVQRQVARDRIEQAAWVTLSEKGLAATAEEVATEAGVSVRTVFRHYGTRDHMIASALHAQLSSYRDALPRPTAETSLEDWLHQLLVEMHRLNAEVGRAYWELAASGDTLDGELAEVAAMRRAARNTLVSAVANTAWRLGGGQGRPPPWLVDVFAIHLSSFATRALVADFSRRPADVARASTRALLAALDAARAG